MRRGLAGLLVAALLVIAGCGGGGGGGSDEVRLGYFPNITQAVPIVASAQGILRRELGDTRFSEQLFLSGPEAVSSILAGSIDAAWVGPGPLITAASRAPGEIVVLDGATESGAVLVARPGSGIRSAADLSGMRVALPSFGNTQDLTLRHILRGVGLAGNDQGGDVRLVAIRNSLVQTALQNDIVDAALIPEPWAADVVADGDAEVVLDADEVLNGGRYPTTMLVASAAFARDNPALVRRLRAANADAVDLVRRRPALAARDFTALSLAETGKAPPFPVLLAALGRQTATTRVDEEGVRLLVEAAERSGYLRDPVPIEALLPVRG
jgi:NitT/TauT family transport system substrate-binding protein